MGALIPCGSIAETRSITLIRSYSIPGALTAGSLGHLTFLLAVIPMKAGRCSRRSAITSRSRRTTLGPTSRIRPRSTLTRVQDSMKKMSIMFVYFHRVDLHLHRHLQLRQRLLRLPLPDRRRHRGLCQRRELDLLRSRGREPESATRRSRNYIVLLVIEKNMPNREGGGERRRGRVLTPSPNISGKFSTQLPFWSKTALALRLPWRALGTHYWL